MRRTTVVKLFVGSLVGLAASVVVFIVAGTLALANDLFVMDGPDVVGIKTGLFAWTMLGLAVVAGVGMLVAVAAQFVAWLGAVLETAQLPDKTWFIVVLVAGLVGFGFLATLAYVVGGPHDEQPETDRFAGPLGSSTTGSAATPTANATPNDPRTPVLVHHR